MTSPAERVKELETQVAALTKALTTFIVWTAQSACAPISGMDANKLIDIIEKDGRP